MRVQTHTYTLTINTISFFIDSALKNSLLREYWKWWKSQPQLENSRERERKCDNNYPDNLSLLGLLFLFPPFSWLLLWLEPGRCLLFDLSSAHQTAVYLFNFFPALEDMAKDFIGRQFSRVVTFMTSNCVSPVNLFKWSSGFRSNCLTV